MVGLWKGGRVVLMRVEGPVHHSNYFSDAEAHREDKQVYLPTELHSRSSTLLSPYNSPQFLKCSLSVALFVVICNMFVAAPSYDQLCALKTTAHIWLIKRPPPPQESTQTMYPGKRTVQSKLKKGEGERGISVTYHPVIIFPTNKNSKECGEKRLAGNASGGGLCAGAVRPTQHAGWRHAVGAAQQGSHGS